MRTNPKADEFKVKYPLLFREGCLRSGYHCPEGWLFLVNSLCSTIENQLNNFVPEEIRGEIYVAQIKEKFGGLRFYMNESTPYIDGAISFAEKLSYNICEACGAPGKLRQNGYLRTLCDADVVREEEENKELSRKYKAEQSAKAKEKATKRLLEDSLKK